LFNCLTGAQWNPLGLQVDLKSGYRYRLFDSQSPLLRDTFVGAKMILRANAAFVRVGFGVELQPLAVLTLRADVEHRGYFGSVGMIQSYDGPYAPHDEETASAAAKAGANYATTGHQITLQAVFRAKAGPVAVLNELELHHYRMALRPGDRVFYDRFLDTLVPGMGWALINHAHLLYLTDFRLVLGLRYTLVQALYPEGWLDPGRGNPNTPNHKVGPLVGYVFGDHGPLFRRPMLVLVLNWWLRSRYRTGKPVSQAIPYGVVAFQFSGEIWSK
jgi:hypothetical protein